MPSLPIPLNEDARLEELHELEIIDSAPEKDFDDLIELAASIYGCPMASISFIDRNRQWYKAKVGLPYNETTREASFCTYTILEEEAFIVPDASKDDRFSSNDAVTGELQVRFYAGVPIKSPKGSHLGAICVIDHEPRELTTEEAHALRIISRQVTKLLELRSKNKVITEKAQQVIELEKSLTRKTLQEQERERQSVANELHENIAQSLAATKFYLEVAHEQSGEPLVGKAVLQLNEVIKGVRSLSKAMAPTTLSNGNVEDLLEGLAASFTNRTGIPVQFCFEGQSRIAHELAMIIYRITEEQFNNIRSHANARQVRIGIAVAEEIRLDISDDGIGLDAAQFRKGCGLQKVLTLAEQFGGTARISNCAGTGCSLEVRIPLLGKSGHATPAAATAAEAVMP